MPKNALSENKINPQKLLLSKWTAVNITDKEKHFIVKKIHMTGDSKAKVESIEIEAILSHNIKYIPWQELKNKTKWMQGWV